MHVSSVAFANILDGLRAVTLSDVLAEQRREQHAEHIFRGRLALCGRRKGVTVSFWSLTPVTLREIPLALRPASFIQHWLAPQIDTSYNYYLLKDGTPVLLEWETGDLVPTVEIGYDFLNFQGAALSA